MKLDLDAKINFGAYQVELGFNENVSSVVVILAGIGSDFSKAPEFDFQGIGSSSAQHSFIYVKDNSRSWYTNPDGWMSLVGFLQEIIENNSSSIITLLGSSMGGAGVLRLAKYIKATRVIAISPRSSLKTDFDIRNSDVVKAVENPELLDYFPAAIDVEYIILFSIDDYEDTLHVARLSFPSYWIRGGHNIAYTFKKLDLLEVFFEALCADCSSLEHLGFRKSTVSTFDCALQRNSNIFDFSACDESVIPEYSFDAWYQKELIRSSGSQSQGHLFFPAHYVSRLAGADLEKYLFYGWSHLEDWGVWGVGPVHTLGFKLLESASTFKIDVNILFTVFKPDAERGQHVVVLLNGSRVFDGVLKDDRCLLTFPAMENDNNVIIVTKDHISPAECTIADDKRSLSVGIEEIFFKPILGLG